MSKLFYLRRPESRAPGGYEYLHHVTDIDGNYLDDHGLTEREFANLIGWQRASLHNYLADMLDLPAWVYPNVAQVMQTTKTQLRRPLGPSDYLKEEEHG